MRGEANQNLCLPRSDQNPSKQTTSSKVAHIEERDRELEQENLKETLRETPREKRKRIFISKRRHSERILERHSKRDLEVVGRRPPKVAHIEGGHQVTHQVRHERLPQKKKKRRDSALDFMTLTRYINKSFNERL